MPFVFKETSIVGVMIIEPRVFPDDRGFFMETYKASDFCNAGITENFVQDNLSSSTRGVLRGIHYQVNPFAQGKLVRVNSGSVWDVAVDLRRNSGTFGKWTGIELSGENKKMFYIPPGFGHGFAVLSDVAEFTYKCTAEYNPKAEGGIRWNDPELSVQWPLPADIIKVSARDEQLPLLGDMGKDWSL